jgi:DegV family protein with EDD domain
MNKIALITDSTADIPAELARKNKIVVVPIAVVIDGQSMDDGDSEGASNQRISREEFYSQLPNMKVFPTTAAPSPATIQHIYENLFSQGYQGVVAILLSSELSATYNNAVLAARSFGENVCVIDSRQISAALGFQVLETVDLLQQIERDEANIKLTNIFERVKNNALNVRNRLRLLALINTFEFLKRSGRVNWAQATVGSLLNVKMIVEVKDGRVIRWGQARTRRSGIERIIESIRSMGKLDRLAVFHSVLEDPAEMPYMLKELLPSLDTSKRAGTTQADEPLMTCLTPIIGAHVGTAVIGAVGLAHNPLQ